jgi:D-tyrosyl-tRNA(Tyr) deacylase
LYEHFVQCCEGLCANVQKGAFGAHMEVSLVNDGPITILCSSDPRVISSEF